jgi:pimeloyl-ACP methyl ester carboxylesterase
MTDTLRQFMAEVLSCPAYHSFLDGAGRAAMSTAFDNLHVPTLFVAGEQDRIIPPPR